MLAGKYIFSHRFVQDIFTTAVVAGVCDITLKLSGLKELGIACLIIYHGLYLNKLSEILKTLKFVIPKLRSELSRHVL
jgi:hypothetical protein